MTPRRDAAPSIRSSRPFGLEQMLDFRVIHRGSGDRAILSTGFFRHLTWGRRAILAVPSLNNEGGFHSVYWNGSQVFDPSRYRTYASWEQLMPDEIILFAENGERHPR